MTRWNVLFSMPVLFPFIFFLFIAPPSPRGSSLGPVGLPVTVALAAIGVHAFALFAFGKKLQERLQA